VDTFESDGLFWLPEGEDNQVAGRVSFDPAKGTRLALIGGFSETTFGDFGDGSQISVVHGVAGKRFLTLVDCSRVSRRYESPGFMRDEYRADCMFAGQALLSSNSVKFGQVSARFSNLYDWIGHSSVSRNHEFDAQHKLTKSSLTLTPFKTIEHAANGYVISVSGVWKILGSEQKPGFEEDFSIGISYDTPVDFSSIKADLTVLQDLLTATTDSVCVPTAITLEIPPEAGESDRRTASVQAYVQQTAYARAADAKPSDMILRLGDIGGIGGVARWFEFVRDRRVVLGLMLSSTYTKMYTENKFFNAVSATETLHRMEFPNEILPVDEYKYFRRMLVKYVPKQYRSWLSQQLAYSNEPRLRDRLAELAEYAGLPTLINCDARQWAKSVTDARNRMVHHDKGKGPGASTVELYWLAESLKLLLLLCLAKFCEFPDGYSEKIRAVPSVEFVCQRVGELMEPPEPTAPATT
jgi:hypothetical protein